jgi:hypothetical protein
METQAQAQQQAKAQAKAHGRAAAMEAYDALLQLDTARGGSNDNVWGTAADNCQQDDDYDDGGSDYEDDDGDDEDDDRGDRNESHFPKEMSHAEHSSRLMKKRFDAMTHKAEYLKVALLRRNDVIESLRTAYLKDVLALKTVINNVLKDDKERELILSTYNAYIPCVDLTAALPLHGPQNAFFKLNACDSCGGCVEVKILDADQVTKLRQQLVQKPYFVIYCSVT